ncbi:MAG TPA: toll/interleukin-1 receptor domain-containing protein [Pseudobdellovibrionaceae bacterium]|nr:toll/interleukin-1 receptor domain-containing protein [Pseudobdellovibrionaceae bacterium]
MLNRKDLFISHSSQDQGVVAALCEALESYGLSTWFSSGHSRIQSGELWTRQVADALRDGSQFLLVISEKAMASENVQDEIQMALKLKKRIFIVSLENEADTMRLIQQSGFNFLASVMIHYARSLKRDETRDPFDKSAREIAAKVKGRANKRALKSLAVACALSCLVVYSGSLWSALRGALPRRGEREPVQVTRTSPPVASKPLARTGAAVPSSPSGQAATAPVPPVAKPLVLPRFVKNPEISLRSRLLGTWTATGPQQMIFNLQYHDGKIEGSVRIGDKCRLLLTSTTLDPGYVVLRPRPGNGSCGAKNLHIGYRSGEKIQVVVEGGELSTQNFYREL